MTNLPFFSVVIPVWNRRDLIIRCLESIFCQDYSDYETIVVDDHSDDGTSEAVAKYQGERFHVIRKAVNEGVCAARCTGTSAATGTWLVWVDSDWELLPGALERLHQMALAAPPDVGVIGGLTSSDKGEIWPACPFPEGPFGFLDYLKWFNACANKPSDWLACHRREVFDAINWPTDFRFETQFHLRVAKNWNYWVCNQILSIEYTSSENRITADRTEGAKERKFMVASDQFTMLKEIMGEFGHDLRQHAPHGFRAILYGASLQGFLAGRRLEATAYALRFLGRRPFSVSMWAVLFAGLVGPSFLYAIKTNPTLLAAKRAAIKQFPKI